MELLNNKLNELQELSNTSEYATDYQKAMELTVQIEEINQKISVLYEEWEELI